MVPNQTYHRVDFGTEAILTRSMDSTKPDWNSSIKCNQKEEADRRMCLTLIRSRERNVFILSTSRTV